jgi:hypothetical protein
MLARHRDGAARCSDNALGHAFHLADRADTSNDGDGTERVREDYGAALRPCLPTSSDAPNAARPPEPFSDGAPTRLADACARCLHRLAAAQQRPGGSRMYHSRLYRPRPMVDVREAAELAERLLAAELPGRWRHSAGVAARAGGLPGVEPPQRQMLTAAAWLHDVGYAPQLVDTGFHPIDAARHLRVIGIDERVVNLVAHHSCARSEAGLRGLGDLLRREFPRATELPHDELCYCDQTTSPDGEVVDVTERLAEVRQRYGDGHLVTQFVDLAEDELVATVRRVEEIYRLQPR